MNKKHTPIYEYSWICKHCNEKINWDSLAESAEKYGVIFLNGVASGYFGTIFTNCFRTFLDKYDNEFLDNIKNELFYSPGYFADFPKFHYHPFPYDFHQNLIIKRSNIFEHRGIMQENEQGWNFVDEDCSLNFVRTL